MTDKSLCGEPRLDDLLADPILELMISRDGLSRRDLDRVIETARKTIANRPEAPAKRAA